MLKKGVGSFHWTLDKIFAYKLDEVRFKLFAGYHILSLVIIIAVIISALLLLKQLRHEQSRRRFRIILAACLFALEISRVIWLCAGNAYDIKKELPLELCSFMVIVTLFALITKNRFLYEILYFLGIAAAAQVLITPNALYPPPHYHYLHTMIAHTILVFTPLYFTFVEKFRPRNAFSMIKVFLAGNLLMVAVYIYNSLMGTNYMVLMGPIDNPTLVDVFMKFFGKPPLHIIGFELIAMVIFPLLYCPWWFQKKPFAGRNN